MKFSLFCPHFPPQNCGVGDFTFSLAKALRESGHEVTLYHGEQLKAQLPFESDTEGLIQYTPYLFPSLYSCFRIFSKNRNHISIFFHELFFPPSWSLRGIFIGLPHWFRFVILLHFARRSLFSTARFCAIWSKRLPYLKHKMFWIPVGSSIPVAGCSSSPAEEIILLHFGGAHPTHLYDFVFDAFESVARTFLDRRVRLVLVGVEKNQFPLLKNDPRIIFEGYLDAKTVSKKINDATLVLAPFLDGVSTRRSTLMCALEHAKPVITTIVEGADAEMTPWHQFLVAVPMLSDHAITDYSKKVVEWVNKPKEEREVLSQRAKEYYEQNFSWPMIVQRILKSLK